jgi:hypothetical protein
MTQKNEGAFSASYRRTVYSLALIIALIERHGQRIALE